MQVDVWMDWWIKEVCCNGNDAKSSEQKCRWTGGSSVIIKLNASVLRRRKRKCFVFAQKEEGDYRVRVKCRKRVTRSKL